MKKKRMIIQLLQFHEKTLQKNFVKLQEHKSIFKKLIQ